MHLETIRDFNWKNEPEVGFSGDALVIKTEKETDFWQDKCHGVIKDNGHFFHISTQGDFTLTVKTNIADSQALLCQSGIMGRIDDENWCKSSLIIDDSGRRFLLVSVTHFGQSDLSLTELSGNFDTITLRLQSKSGMLYLSYSTDEQDFIQSRRFQMLKEYALLNVGAYASNPSKEPYHPVWLNIELN